MKVRTKMIGQTSCNGDCRKQESHQELYCPSCITSSQIPMVNAIAVFLVWYFTPTDTRVQYPTHQASYFQYPMHYPAAAAAYNVQPSVHAAYLQQQPHPLAATQFTSVASPSLSHQVCSVPVSQQVMGIPSPTHPLQQPVSLVTGWADGHKMTQVQLAPGHYD